MTTHAIVVIDKSGSLQFKNQLASYLKKKMNTGNNKVIKKVKMQDSEKNNLLQLVDYIAGITNKFVRRDSKAAEYRKIIAHREIRLQIWPRG